MHELADDVAGIISGEEHDDVRDVLLLRQPSSVFPTCPRIACPLPFCLMSLVVPMAAHPTPF